MGIPELQGSRKFGKQREENDIKYIKYYKNLNYLHKNKIYSTKFKPVCKLCLSGIHSIN